jgi:anthranilate phosphoribosyltransferase
VSFSSIFHPAYATIHQQAAFLLGQTKMAVFKGESGEIERKPDATCLIKRIDQGALSEEKWPRLQEAKQDAIEGFDLNIIKQVYQGTLEHSYGQCAIISTLAIALSLIDSCDEATAMAKAEILWQQRNSNNPIFN